jgi:hypothetical protein
MADKKAAEYGHMAKIFINVVSTVLCNLLSFMFMYHFQ